MKETEIIHKRENEVIYHEKYIDSRLTINATVYDREDLRNLIHYITLCGKYFEEDKSKDVSVPYIPSDTFEDKKFVDVPNDFPMKHPVTFKQHLGDIE